MPDLPAGVRHGHRRSVPAELRKPSAQALPDRHRLDHSPRQDSCRLPSTAGHDWGAADVRRSPRGRGPLHLQRQPAGRDAVPATEHRPTCGSRLVTRKRRGAATLVRPARRLLRRGWDRVLLLRQARRWRVGGEVLPGRLRSLQPRDGGRGRRGPPIAADRPEPRRVPRSQRSRVGRTKGGRGLKARRLSRPCQPRRPATQHRGEFRAVRRRKHEHQAATVEAGEVSTPVPKLRPAPPAPDERPNSRTECASHRPS